MRVASTPGNPVNARTVLGYTRQMIRPQIVDRSQGDALLPLGQVALQNLLTSGVNLGSLPFGRYFVAVQEDARIEMLALDLEEEP